MKRVTESTSPAEGGKRPSRSHDRSRRMLFHHRRMVEDLLRGFVEAPAIRDLDFETLAKLSTDFVADGLEERLGDVVWRVNRRDGPLYVLIVIEFQSIADPSMALRMLVYVVLFYQRLLKVQPLKLMEGERLPPVLPILFYNEEEDYSAARDLASLIAEVPAGLERYQPSFEYVLIDELRWPCEALTGLQNAVATFLRLQQSDPREIRELVLQELALDWLEEEERGLLRDILEWISLVLLSQRQPEVPVPKFKSLDDLKSYMERDMETWSDMLRAEGRSEGRVERRVEGLVEGRVEGMAEGLVEGRVEGMAEGQASIVLAQIEEKFGAVDEAVATRVRSADAKDLLAWAKRLLSARRLGEIFLPNGN